MIEDNMNMMIKIFFMNVFSFLIFFRIMNYKNIDYKKKIGIFISIIILCIGYSLFKNIMDIIISVFILDILQTIILKFITKLRIYNILIGVVISISLTYVFFTLAVTLEFIIQQLLRINNNTINMLVTVLIEFIIIYLVLKIKRLKNGLTFLQKRNEYIELALMNISCFIIILYGLLGSSYEKVVEHLVFYFIILVICMIITVQRILIMYYKQKLIDDTINDYKKELQEKDDEIKKLTEEAFKISKVNHEFYNRQKSLELMVKKNLKEMNMEAGEDLDMLGRIQNITAEHSEKMSSIKSLPELPLTDIVEIDDMFRYMQVECSNSKINFELRVNGNIHALVNNIIPKNKLETLIGDHIRDAIIAINSAESSHKEILVILGLIDDCYELCIFDTGIEFEIETLINLGIVPITTHKDSGGSGIGFVTTFETMKECKASLIIEERHPINDSDYTKAIRFRFDGRCEYKICSYRSEEINSYNKDNRAIVYKYNDT